MLVPFLFIFFLWLPAWAVLGYWFVIQFLSGVGTALVQNEKGMGGVAFWAHVGGFAAGFGLMSLFPARVRRYMYR
jgi:membrane associated rhomboid family serine protease